VRGGKRPVCPCICQPALLNVNTLFNPSARARDFYDIHRTITKLGIDLASEANLELSRQIFEVKQVPLSLLPKIVEQREFHRQDWPAVKATAGDPVQEFDFYFDFVLNQIERLKALWVE
jgi:hypothetical protein